MKKFSFLLVIALIVITSFSVQAQELELAKDQWNVYAYATTIASRGSSFGAYIENTSKKAGGEYEPESLKLRYFFTLDAENTDNMTMLAHERINNGQISGSGPEVWDKENKIYYCTFDITSNWKEPEVNSDKYCHIDAMFSIMCSSGTWNPDNDWSWQNLDTRNTVKIGQYGPEACYAPNFVLYDSEGAKIYGNEPPKPPVEEKWNVYTHITTIESRGSSFSAYIENTSKEAGGVYEPESLKLRYFFTLDEENADNLTMLAHERLNCGEITGSSPEVWDEKNKVYYYTFDMEGLWRQPEVESNKYCHIDATFSIMTSSGTWNPDNDWSWQNLDTSNPKQIYKYGAEAYYTPNFVLYDSKGVKIYGNEPPKEETASVVYGDVSGDGRVDSIDFAFLRKHILGMLELTPDEYNAFKAAADVNQDGKINSIDLGLFKMYLLGRLSLLPVTE